MGKELDARLIGSLSRAFVNTASQRKAWICIAYKKRRGPLLCCGLIFLTLTVFLHFWFSWSLSQAFDDAGRKFSSNATGWWSENRSSKQSPSSNNGDNKLRIVVCAKVTLETPYLLEWIEFHRLQGVDKFVLYHDAIPSEPKTVASWLELQSLVNFYRDVEKRRRQEEQGAACEEAIRNGASSCQPGRGAEDVIEVQSASLLIEDSWPALKELDHNTAISHEFFQLILLSDCINRYKHKAEYMMHIDGDEFVYSPTYDSVFDFLESRKNQWHFPGFKVVGYYIPHVNFGSSGRLWDFHNFYAAGSSAGTVTAYYDQRDSSLFQFLQRLNESSVSSSPLELAAQLDEFRLSRLKDQSAFASTDANEFSELVHRRLLHDFPSSISETPFLDALVIPALNTSKSKDSPLSGLADHIDALMSQMSQIRATREPQHSHNSSSASAVASPDLSESAKLYQYYVQNSALFYPLVIEEQTRREPTTRLDGRWVGTRLAAELFPVCRLPFFRRRQFLVEQKGLKIDPVKLKAIAHQFSLLCRGKLTRGLTVQGKQIYKTSLIRPSQETRSSGRLRGCHYPSVHSCAHNIYGGYIQTVDITRDLRLDHHQFRSYQRRSFDLPRWRGGPLGYPAQMDFTAVQEFLDSVVDTGKLRFVPKLRARLAQLDVLPKMPDYAWKTKTNGSQVIEISIDRQNVTKKCSAIELLGQRQIMCPSDFPYVGYYYLKHVRYQPYSWCSDVPMDPTVNPWEQILDLRQFYPNDQNLTDDQLRDKHTALGPGYEEVRRCDYDPKLQMYESSQFLEHPKEQPP